MAQGYRFFGVSGRALTPPHQSAVVRYFEARAPVALPPQERFPEAAHPLPIALERRSFAHSNRALEPAVSNVRFVQLSNDRIPDVLACDMRHGQLLAIRRGDASDSPRVLCDSLHNPGHVEVVDLDGDGLKDILVADLGSFVPSDQKLGSVIWLRAGRDGTFTPMPLAWGLGRVADVQAADFDGDGDLDLVVAVFGMQVAGEILYLENRTRDYARPEFLPARLDPRHGAIHVPVADLNGDGRPDFVALFAQEHETVVAFLNAGAGRFTREVVYTAPHPAFGSSGIELVDLDKDGDLDVLYTNGDVLDGKPILRPDHGVHWLENRGGFPFQEHRLASLYGASRAVAADMDGDGDLDVVASSFLPSDLYGPRRRRLGLASVILLEQTTPRVFVRHVLETVTADHITCDVGDFDGDGRMDLALGNFASIRFDASGGTDDPDRPRDSVVIERNLGPAPSAPGGAGRVPGPGR